MSYSYPRPSLVVDYVRAGLGALVTAGPVVLVSMPPVVLAILSSLATLFFAYGIVTVLRHRTKIDVSDDWIAVSPRGRKYFWKHLKSVRLKYYSTRRDHRGGWMQLVLTFNNKRLGIDSRLQGFDDIVRRATAAARRVDLALDATSLSNLAALGVSLNDERPTYGSSVR